MLHSLGFLGVSESCAPPPPPELTGHVSSFPPYQADMSRPSGCALDSARISRAAPHFPHRPGLSAPPRDPTPLRGAERARWARRQGGFYIYCRVTALLAKAGCSDSLALSARILKARAPSRRASRAPHTFFGCRTIHHKGRSFFFQAADRERPAPQQGRAAHLVHLSRKCQHRKSTLTRRGAARRAGLRGGAYVRSRLRRAPRRRVSPRVVRGEPGADARGVPAPPGVVCRALTLYTTVMPRSDSLYNCYAAL